MTLNGQPFRIYSDQVGSVRVVADEQGRVVQEIRYCSFGRILEQSDSGFPMPLGFAGGLHDRDVGWVRFGFRDYDPVTGRFTAPDPLGYAAGDPDLYGYCLDDPVNNIDPAGLEGNATDGGFWDGPGGRIVKSGIKGAVSGAMEGATLGAATGSPFFGVGAGPGAAAGAALGAPVGMLWGVGREIFFSDDDSDIRDDMMEQREQLPKKIDWNTIKR